MRYTALALDYDGTIAKDGVVAPHVLEGLHALKATGRKLLLVTGRELEELLGIFPGIGVFDRVVAENGALLYRPASRERHELGEPPPDSLVSALKASGIPLAVGHTILATVRPHETVVLECIAGLGLEQQVIFNKGAVMVLPPGCNKASGLKFALGELGLSPRNTVAGGDGENDHAMLEYAEYAVCTANGIATLKDAADYVTQATHGDGVLEVIHGLLADDLASLPPIRRRRALCLGQDPSGAQVAFPSRRTSILVVGEPRDTSPLVVRLLERLCKAGYQFCAVDTRGDFLDMRSAVVFGTLENPPAAEEVLTGLDKPDVQAVACLAAVPAEERSAFAGRLLAALRKLRTATGRPHWILLDEAQELVAPGPGDMSDGAENTIYVSADPASLAPGLLACVDGVAACGDRAHALLDAVAASVGWDRPAIPERSPREDEALVWFRKSERPVTLVRIAPVQDAKTPMRGEHRERSAEVGQVLRRA